MLRLTEDRQAYLCCSFATVSFYRTALHALIQSSGRTSPQSILYSSLLNHSLNHFLSGRIIHVFSEIRRIFPSGQVGKHKGVAPPSCYHIVRSSRVDGRCHHIHQQSQASHTRRNGSIDRNMSLPVVKCLTGLCGAQYVLDGHGKPAPRYSTGSSLL